MGTSAPQILSTGASRYSKLSSTTEALQNSSKINKKIVFLILIMKSKGHISYQISAPTPCCGKPSSTVTSRFVFLTETLMASLSSGRIERRFITSAVIPSLLSISAACNKATFLEAYMILFYTIVAKYKYAFSDLERISNHLRVSNNGNIFSLSFNLKKEGKECRRKKTYYFLQCRGDRSSCLVLS